MAKSRKHLKRRHRAKSAAKSRKHTVKRAHGQPIGQIRRWIKANHLFLISSGADVYFNWPRIKGHLMVTWEYLHPQLVELWTHVQPWLELVCEVFKGLF
jgi:hypothetical protein